METSIYEQHCAQRLSGALPKGVVYMCIGTSAVASDSLGPLVGSLLQRDMSKPLFVYGFSASNITALNLCAAYELIKLLHPDKKVLVIDAAVGEENERGKIIFNNFPLLPGAATKKHLCAVGDYSLMGVVAQRNLHDFYDTAADKKILVSQMAQVIATAIHLSANDHT